MSGGSTPPSEPGLRPPTPRWEVAPPPDDGTVRALMEELRLPRALCGALAVRGVSRPEDARRFLRPRIEHLHPPELLADGPPAAERILEAVASGETILVHGDYDVDGICATALLTRWLRRLGGRVVPFTPHRLRDGYDFGDAGLRAAKDAGATLVVTVDCGSVAHDALARAGDAELDVIVTDHHMISGPLPPALAVVNPRRPDCPYPDKDLCGTALAFKLCLLLADGAGIDPGEVYAFLDLVALATVADLVPLSGENRVLVRYGLRRFAHTRVPGVRALLEVAQVDPGDVTAGRLGFVVGPRINAAGRVGESGDALKLLLTDDLTEARGLARDLDATNRIRREEDLRTLDEALELLEAEYDPGSDRGVVLASEGWHPGVIGIVASRVVERIHRPTVLIALDGDRGRGSARSIPGFHLYDALSACSGHMLRFGGHRQAAGMDLRRDAVDAFRAAFNREATARLSPEDLHPTLRADLEVRLSEVDLGLAHYLGYAGPHGIGNPAPVFLARELTVEGPRTVGGGHLKATLRHGGDRLDAIGFGLSSRHPPETLSGGLFDALFRVERNEWRGVSRVQARLLDLRPAGDVP